jgi:RNA polymerase sigma-70 factor (ECF subfamily)
LALRVAGAWLRDHAAAEEAAQESALRLWRFRGSLDRAASPEAWIVQVAKNEASRVSERRGRTHAREHLVDLDEAVPGFARDEADEPVLLRVSVMAAVARLSEQDRKILLLHYFGDMPLASIAQRLGLPVGTVKARLSRARHRLAQDLIVETHNRG